MPRRYRKPTKMETTIREIIMLGQMGVMMAGFATVLYVLTIEETPKIMATMITEECINCGACEPECPNEAISEGEDIYVIDPALCTECVGHFDEEQCAVVCPVDCCVPDPNIVETELLLLGRAKKIFPDKNFDEDFPSRFKRINN